jgi:hypothetical protein
VARATLAPATGLPSVLPGPADEAEPLRTVPISLQAAPPRLAKVAPPADVLEMAADASSGASIADWQTRATALQELGAVEYALEKWGESGKLYRFACLVAAAPTDACWRHFEAVDKDGGRAVERVLQQVRTWRGVAAMGR